MAGPGGHDRLAQAYEASSPSEWNVFSFLSL